jgi:hypothetical protein
VNRRKQGSREKFERTHALQIYRREVITGVRWAYPSIRFAAATTSSKVGKLS